MKHQLFRVSRPDRIRANYDVDDIQDDICSAVANISGSCEVQEITAEKIEALVESLAGIVSSYAEVKYEGYRQAIRYQLAHAGIEVSE